MGQYISVFRKPKLAEATQWNGSREDADRIISWVEEKREVARFVAREEVKGVLDRDCIVVSDDYGRSVVLPDYWLVFDEESRFSAHAAVHFAAQYERTVVPDITAMGATD